MRLADLLQPATKNENGTRTPATVATSATLEPELSQLSQLSQGVTFENHFSDPPTAPATQTDRVRARLLRIAEAHGIDAEVVHTIASDEALRFSLDLNDYQLTRWLNIVGTRWMTEHGKLKPGTWAIPSVAHLPPAEVQP